MGLTAIVSSAANAVSSSASSASASSASASAISLTSPVGAGIGGVFVAAALVFLLAYLDVLNASEVANAEVRRTVLATAIPLALVFVGIVAFQSLQVL
jgi:hypothetical protein